MSPWPLRKLGDLIAGLEGGRNLAASDGGDSELRILKVSAVTSGRFRASESKPAPRGHVPPPSHFVRRGDLLISRANTTELVGAVALVEYAPAALLLPDKIWRFLWREPSPVLPDYLHAYLRTPRVRQYLRTMATGTSDSMRNISQPKLLALEIPTPPIDRQTSIVDLLNRAAGITRLHEAALAKAREAVPALFVSMFGDPASNPKGWAVATLGDLASIQGGLQVTAKRAEHPLSVDYLRVANVFRDRLDLDEIKTMRVTEAELARTELRAGDLLVVEGHGNPAEVGRVAIWDGSIPTCVHQNHLIRARLDEKRLLPSVAAAYLNSEAGRIALIRSGKTTSGLNTISTANVKRAEVMLPPIELQYIFATRLADLRSIIAQQERALALARETERALMAQLLG